MKISEMPLPAIPLLDTRPPSPPVTSMRLDKCSYFDNDPISSLPPSITELTLGHRFNGSIRGLALLSSLESLIIICPLKHSLVGVLPASLTHLSLFGHFKYQDEHVVESFANASQSLPRSLITLNIGNWFNRPLQSLPHALTSLTFGDHFNSPLPNPLPRSLITLKFGQDFNQPLDQELPHSITSLHFGYCFNQVIEPLPASLTSLRLGDINGHYSHSFKLPLPKSLTALWMSSWTTVTSGDIKTLTSSSISVCQDIDRIVSSGGMAYPENLVIEHLTQGHIQEFGERQFQMQLESLTVEEFTYRRRPVAALINLLPNARTYHLSTRNELKGITESHCCRRIDKDTVLCCHSLLDSMHFHKLTLETYQ
ncbi:hypothetical protein SAMD00019534_089400 [Acytostelium subglobosum LB1]|uniref:hypothetical protein n=1 Tax=Acytostelium subglobosum LB1 TaxID=1410327 RepID=UPI000644B3B3|nr:hypothetical protein SAMD00019534_089400 [Acytostelium subglobosum LB1]GAM25765.1 hypothetical protein SAMD00019534_089400 [Acytostelium subglobosum LB1]|eukprot:XP_012751283.1 hypothetical protein SAMD00019534_089400 [Acytostelium subglobosum LB1]